MMNYNNRRFKPVKQTDNSEIGENTIFIYKQKGNMLTAEYLGGKIRKGHLIGLVDPDGKIEMRYHQINRNDELMTGTCVSIPELDTHGKIRLYESWEWTSGDRTKGTSVLVEI